MTSTKQTKSEILERIRANFPPGDGCASVLDDVWCNEMSAKARELITEEEHNELTLAVASEDQYHEAVDEAVTAILKQFVYYLAEKYDLELAETDD